uniref:Cyclic GMP-AMP synthase n=1 Tax=Calidris pygmaea TaxID=425635 RepID=A0A8C3K4A9_9CHAR
CRRGRRAARTARPARPPPASGAPSRCRRRRGCRTSPLGTGTHGQPSTPRHGPGLRAGLPAAPSVPPPRFPVPTTAAPSRPAPPPAPAPAPGRTDGADPVGEQQRAGPAAGGRRRRLRPRMAPTDHHHLVPRGRPLPGLAARPPVPGPRRGWRQAAAGPAQQHGGGRRGGGEAGRPPGPGPPRGGAARRGGAAAGPVVPSLPERRGLAAVPDGAAGVCGGAPRLREVLSRLSLPRQDVSEASGLVNRVVSQLIQAVRGRGGSFGSIERLGAGSYYEHVKISEPNEFDIMLLMPVARLQLDECDDTGAYYYLSFKRNPKEKYLLKFLDEDGKLSAFKMLQALREIIKQEVKTIKDAEVTVKRKKAGSPAITLQIRNPPTDISVDIILTLEVQQSWPPSTQDGLRVEQWLGRKVRGELRNKSLYLVAKQNKKEKVLRGNTWRLSFSHIEKAMLNNHGSSKTCCESDGPKCCRKGCLKLLKYLLEQLKMKYTKELDKFCSYHVKTAYFHSCVMWPNDTDWHWGDLEHCFHKYLGYFLDCLQRSQLPHFFIPQYNLLSPEDKASNNFLSRQLNYQLNNNFPIFQEIN